jgi:hypothetical protein
VTVKKPHKSLSLKPVLDSQTPFLSLLKRLRRIAEKCGSDIREAGRNLVDYRDAQTAARRVRREGRSDFAFRDLAMRRK